MTPFGARLRMLREDRGLALRDMAAALGLSAAYLSALEHGYRGQPGSGLILQICGVLELDWEAEAELKALAGRSKPKVTIDTGGLHPKATRLVNELAETIRDLEEPELDRMLDCLASRIPEQPR